ncbi:MAG: serine/threonine-protein kinase HipA, partial [Rubritalea sp.]
YTYKPSSKRVNSHRLSLNGKRGGFTRNELYSLETLIRSFSTKKINQVSQWPTLAWEYDVLNSMATGNGSNLRLKL